MTYASKVIHLIRVKDCLPLLLAEQKAGETASSIPAALLKQSAINNRKCAKPILKEVRISKR
jgi:hypothetical protein